MKTDNKHHRKSIRLKEYDYSQPGEYFVTICTHSHECVLGKIIHGEMRLNEIGKIVEKCWKEIPIHFPNTELDEFVVMPNHIHGIIVLRDYSRDVQLNVPTRLSPRRWTLSVIIRTYKAAVTTE
jgi:REP element-mobilizing transposase RayT